MTTLTLLDCTKISGSTEVMTERPSPTLPRTPSLPLPLSPALRRRPRDGWDGRKKLVCTASKRESLRWPRTWAEKPAA